ncbi:alpha/beta hydrolase family protein [Haliscomenobacter sp.]|uniref:alpha/beta hydrolase family protein n=1 Tax=Haliscomenobacter sp. TaxID=2717303 RepID=UPI003BAD315E
MQRFSPKALMLMTCLFLILSCDEKDMLSEQEKSALFATPSTAETDSIFAQWKQRDLTPRDYTVIQESTILDGKYTFKMLSFKINGIKEYGALLIPKTDVSVPVRLLIGGFGLDITTNSVNLSLDSSDPSGPYILAIPALRGQSLAITLNGTLYSSPLSEGVHCDAFDGATDDAIAFLNLVQQTESKADVNRSSIRGGSRGGTVALLAGIRDPRIKRVVDVVGPTDLLTLTSLHENDPTYLCQFLNDLKNKQATLAETRNKLIASSPLYFAQHLPLTQLHMGLKDKNVPVDQAYGLEQKMTQLGLKSLFQLYTYDKTHADIATDNPELAKRIAEFLAQL